jgi:hypothetical protein
MFVCMAHLLLFPPHQSFQKKPCSYQDSDEKNDLPDVQEQTALFRLFDILHLFMNYLFHNHSLESMLITTRPAEVLPHRMSEGGWVDLPDT